MINIVANGKPRQLESPMSVARFLEVHGVDARAVAVMLDGRVLSREELSRVEVVEGVTVEVVRMVGGG